MFRMPGQKAGNCRDSDAATDLRRIQDELLLTIARAALRKPAAPAGRCAPRLPSSPGVPAQWTYNREIVQLMAMNTAVQLELRPFGTEHSVGVTGL